MAVYPVDWLVRSVMRKGRRCQYSSQAVLISLQTHNKLSRHCWPLPIPLNVVSVVSVLPHFERLAVICDKADDT